MKTTYQTYQGAAFAKLNLYLGIHGLREDGYHELETVFQSIALQDLVAIAVHDRGGISLRCNKAYLPTDEKNLAYKAALAFFRAAGLENPGLHINIKKVIPVGAGMAGGSTDAACVLRLLNRAFGAPLSPQRLAEVALTLGADVPFCLWGGTALAGGVGEKLKPLAAMPPCTIVVAKPHFSVSTKAAFGLYDQRPRENCPSSEGMVAALAGGDLPAIGRNLYNSLEKPVGGKHPRILQLVERLENAGALGARMTGSGSAVFGLFDDPDKAQKAARSLRLLCREVYITAPLAGEVPGDRGE